jgi:hypothetical protein
MKYFWLTLIFIISAIPFLHGCGSVEWFPSTTYTNNSTVTSTPAGLFTHYSTFATPVAFRVHTDINRVFEGTTTPPFVAGDSLTYRLATQPSTGAIISQRLNSVTQSWPVTSVIR